MFLKTTYFVLSFLFCCNSYLYCQPKNGTDSLENLLRQATQDTSKIAIMNKLANLYMFGKPDLCVELANKVVILAKKVGDKKAEAMAYNYIAVVYMRRSSPEAEVYFKKSLALRLSIDDKFGVCSVYSNLCGFYTEQSEYPKALESGLLALKIQDSLKNDKYITKILINIGNVYLQQEHFEDAKKSFRRAEKLNLKIGDKSSEGSIYMNIGYIHQFQKPKQLDSAIICYRKALFASEAINHRFRVADIIGHFGSIYLEMAQYDSSLYYSFKSLKLHEDLEDIYNKSRNLANIAEVKYYLGNHKEAMKYAQLALKVAKEAENKDTEQSAIDLLSMIYKKERNFEKALFYRELATVLHDSIFNEAKTKTLKNLQHEYEIEKHQTEIALLNKDKIIQQDKLILQNVQQNSRQNMMLFFIILAVLLVVVFYWLNKKQQANNKFLSIQNAEINQQKEEIEAQAETLDELNHTKDKLFTIIAHDLRSPLNNLKMTLQLFEKQYINPDEFCDITKVLETNVDTIKDTLDNLLNWSISQLQGLDITPETLNIKDLGIEAITLYKEIADKKGITLRQEIDFETLVIADKNHVRLVLRNLISNAIKFTDEGGEIKITTQKLTNNTLQINIIDNGIGMTAEQSYKLFKVKSHFTSYGTANEKGTGVGLLLCQEFIIRNSGVIGVDSKIGRGSCFFFSLPISKS